MPGAASLAWSSVDAFLRDSHVVASQHLAECQEGLENVQADADSGTFDVAIARGRVSDARGITMGAQWERIALLCARIPALMHNGTLRVATIIPTDGDGTSTSSASKPSYFNPFDPSKQ
jgi:hypothetical protein